ncbi:hydrolase [Sediminicoccus sp. KRV36]|uniref:hydrolase n=1 Tax=Sediminicoccus sp. KRV36 TaxID=3133721 RepID=UPI00200ED439|nr:hydrolase [Sediminicoccus rosea]UPY36435.1 hydrolase [Sediminicoccus rosea]
MAAIMMLHRRALLGGMLAAPFLGRAARAQPGPTPILMVHGNGDHAALWLTTLWRFEANGWPRERLMAVNMPDPLARADDAVPQANRSSAAEQTERLAVFVAELRARTGAPRVALIGNSRGGYPIRDFVVHQGGAAQVSHAITCGTPNRGVFDWEFSEGSEFNGRGPFLRRLNGGASDVVEGTAFLALRSDNDLYAQPDGRFVGRPGTPTGITQEGPSLRGATNILLPGLDHREIAYHWRAFREQFRFIAASEPTTLTVPAEPRPVLNGLVTNLVAGGATNRPVAGAVVEVFRTDPASGARLGEAIHRRETGADGAWGPVTVQSDWALEIILAAPGHPIGHYFRAPFPRSTEVLHLRPPAPLLEADRAAGALVRLTRPRGYFGWPRDVVLLDGREVAERREGVASIAVANLRLPAERVGSAIQGLFNDQVVMGRPVPLAENRITLLEMTW